MESTKPAKHPRLVRAEAIVKLVDALAALGWTYKRESVVTMQGLIVGTPDYIKQWEKSNASEQVAARERNTADARQVPEPVRHTVFDSTDS